MKTPENEKLEPGEKKTFEEEVILGEGEYLVEFNIPERKIIVTRLDNPDQDPE